MTSNLFSKQVFEKFFCTAFINLCYTKLTLLCAPHVHVLEMAGGKTEHMKKEILQSKCYTLLNF